MKCECGNNKFYAHQRCYHDVIVDGNNFFEEDVSISVAETPYGTYTCTECGKQYEELK